MLSSNKMCCFGLDSTQIFWYSGYKCKVVPFGLQHFWEWRIIVHLIPLINVENRNRCIVLSMRPWLCPQRQFCKNFKILPDIKDKSPISAIIVTIPFCFTSVLLMSLYSLKLLGIFLVDIVGYIKIIFKVFVKNKL